LTFEVMGGGCERARDAKKLKNQNQVSCHILHLYEISSLSSKVAHHRIRLKLKQPDEGLWPLRGEDKLFQG